MIWNRYDDWSRFINRLLDDWIAVWLMVGWVGGVKKPRVAWSMITFVDKHMHFHVSGSVAGAVDGCRLLNNNPPTPLWSTVKPIWVMAE